MPTFASIGGLSQDSSGKLSYTFKGGISIPLPNSNSYNNVFGISWYSETLGTSAVVGTDLVRFNPATPSVFGEKALKLPGSAAQVSVSYTVSIGLSAIFLFAQSNDGLTQTNKRLIDQNQNSDFWQTIEGSGRNSMSSGRSLTTFSGGVVSNTITQTHGLGRIPKQVIASAIASSQQIGAETSNYTSTTFQIQCWSVSALTQNVEAAWIAIALKIPTICGYFCVIN